MGFFHISQNGIRVAKNFLSLSVLQTSNYILPLITFPYLVRTLGPENFGLIAFASAFTAYFVVLTDYGFVHTAPRKVAVCRDNPEKLIQVYNSVMFVKLGFLMVGFIILVCLVWSVERFSPDKSLYLVSFLAVIGNVLFPIWFFQGIEDMKYITLLNLLSRLIYVFAIFFFVKTQSDYLMVPVINGLSTIFVGLLCQQIIRRNFKITLVLPSKSCIYEELKEGWTIFWGMAAVSLNYNTNVFVLGLLTNNSLVGYFRAAETLIRAIVGLVNPVIQATYPHVSRLSVESKITAVRFTRKILIGFGLFSLLFSGILFVSAQQIVQLVYGPQYENSVMVLRILAFLPFVIGVSGILGTQGLLAFGFDRQFSSIVVFSGIANLLSAILLIPRFQLEGLATAMIGAEIVTTLAIFGYLRFVGISYLPTAKIRGDFETD